MIMCNSGIIRLHMLLKSVIAFLFIFNSVPNSYAWNIVCGVSILNSAIPENVLEKKWDADSYALKGISYYFMAISEMQRISLNDDGTFSAPQSFTGQGDVLKNAGDYLIQSKESFSNALDTARKMNLGDEKGLGLLNGILQSVDKIESELRDKKHLPSLDELQNLVVMINEYNMHGIELSKMHLGKHLAGHGVGGEKYKIK